MTDILPSSTEPPIRLPNGQFGSGNPGRPPGSKNKVSSRTIAAIKDMAPDALAVLKENLMRNDTRAAIFILERVLPNQRTVELEDASISSIINALTSGDVSPDEARLISQSIAKLREIDELDRVKDRLAEVERLLKG